MKHVMLTFVILTLSLATNRYHIGYAAEREAVHNSQFSSVNHRTRAKKQQRSSHRRSFFSQKRTTSSVAPGEGLGCFYHQGYYSHLPLFKDGSYTLPGSHEVAEPYR
jgi:hypothetical protein